MRRFVLLTVAIYALLATVVVVVCVYTFEEPERSLLAVFGGVISMWIAILAALKIEGDI